ncbi:hypothetical protein FOYG_05251 [Fusarium oxysporum NRRL 32931]|uniref:Uncharacterized protein n=1 Tax=Fusarium oxysporum NRRL 32931 TaxID=660029 RepID=W9IPL1_FUSOX|nr:hypothetical protein FOYG_05251 [Fusarium oxysporum NRRL 32931]
MQILLLFEVRISECTTLSQIGRVLDETTNNYRPEMQSPLGANMGKDNHSQLDLLRQKWPPARVLACADNLEPRWGLVPLVNATVTQPTRHVNLKP